MDQIKEELRIHFEKYCFGGTPSKMLSDLMVPLTAKGFASRNASTAFTLDYNYLLRIAQHPLRVYYRVVPPTQR
jgi:hypothetical protein